MQKQSTPTLNVVKTSGPGFLTPKLVQFMGSRDDSGILVLPIHFFYPISNKERNDIDTNNYKSKLPEALSKEIFTCHLWHCSWQKV